jgi:hypothetical protein
MRTTLVRTSLPVLPMYTHSPITDRVLDKGIYIPANHHLANGALITSHRYESRTQRYLHTADPRSVIGGTFYSPIPFLADSTTETGKYSPSSPLCDRGLISSLPPVVDPTGKRKVLKRKTGIYPRRSTSCYARLIFLPVLFNCVIAKPSVVQRMYISLTSYAQNTKYRIYGR